MPEVNVSINLDLKFRDLQSIKFARDLIRKLNTISYTNQKEINLDEFLNEYRSYAIDLDFIDKVVDQIKKDLKELEGYL